MGSGGIALRILYVGTKASNFHVQLTQNGSGPTQSPNQWAPGLSAREMRRHYDMRSPSRVVRYAVRELMQVWNGENEMGGACSTNET